MKYNGETDVLDVSDDLQNGESDVLKAIASNIPEFARSWDALWDNIVLRGEVRKRIIDYAEKYNDDDLLEAEFVIKSNDRFHNIIDEVRNSSGELNNQKILNIWETWIKRECEKRKLENQTSKKFIGDD